MASFKSYLPLLLGFALAFTVTRAESIDTQFFSAMHWRLVGPFRAGRVTAVAGIPGDPNTYYFGTPGGGIWKTTDAGRVWKPIFDQERMASIGALAVAPSAPNILYAGTGEQTPGNGVYKSTDGGNTWANIGLGSTRYIQAVWVDPRNPDVVLVGANSLGFAIIWTPVPDSARTVERGIFKTTDGGKTWKKVLTRDETAGVVDLCADPDNPGALYAVLYHATVGVGKSATPATSEIVKTTDEGSTWAPLGSKGLPEKDRGRLGIAVAPGNNGRMLYAVMKQGFFRSDDGGANWRKSTQDPRVAGSEYFSRVFVDPQNANTLYVMQTSVYRSIDGGRTFKAFVGAPGGDDYHVLWIDPRTSARMFLGVDQGAIISVDAGRTWTTWFNQPTGQFYHVTTDQVFPYRLYASQQDSGTAAIVSRSDYGEITARDWFPIAGFEYCYIAPDPTDPKIVYSGGWYGSVVKFDKATGQFATVFERGKEFRTAPMAPLLFSPHDPHTLYLGTQFVLKTTDGAATWHKISPDLTGYVENRADDSPPYPPPPAITAIAESPFQAGEIWAGTSNKIVQLTRDGGASWQNVSPSGLDARAQIGIIEASHHDAGTAYISSDTHHGRIPAYIARTHDLGHTWQKIVNGLPEQEMVYVVREDPERKGLLYAGTETGVYVSFDDGDRWQSLQLNLPTATVTDLAILQNDLVASTFGRALWILDDLTAVRETRREILDSGAHLFHLEPAIRARWDVNPDTPNPPSTPAGQNPPDGAILNYYLKPAADPHVILKVVDSNGKLVREYGTTATEPKLPPANVPEFWFAPPEVLPATAGLNRFVWDLRYPAPPSLPYGFFGGLAKYTEYTLPDNAIPGNTPRIQPRGPLVVPGTYTIELSVDGETYRQPLTVELDPRVHASAADLEAQLDLEQRIGRGMAASYDSYKQVASVRKELDKRGSESEPSGRSKEFTENIEGLQKKIEALENGPKRAPGFGPVNRDLTRLSYSVATADARPSETARAAVDENCKALDDDLRKWRELNTTDIPAFNAALPASHKLSPLPVASEIDTKGCGQ